MKRFCINVTSNMGFLTLEGSTTRFTTIGTDVIAKDQQDANDQIRSFLSSIRPFHGMATGLSREEADEVVASRKKVTSWLENFVENCNDIWTAKLISATVEHHIVTITPDAEY